MNLSDTVYTYNGRKQKPSVTILDKNGKKLKNKTDYTISYPKNLKNVGSYTVTVTFKGKYSGTMKKKFTINPKGTSISSITAKKKAILLKWRKQAAQVTGYEISYSTDSKFSKKNSKIIPIGKNKTVSKTLTKLKARKKYFVRIRTYKTVNEKRYYSDWSKVKKAVTKNNILQSVQSKKLRALFYYPISARFYSLELIPLK